MNAIVAVDQNWAIGQNETLLFSLPTDMRHFRSLTLGGTVIMGRKTLDSFPNGKPLPKRRNIVITRNSDFQREGVETCLCPEDALELAKDEDPNKLWVIGGGSIYTALLQRCERVYLTRVDTCAEEADTFFPNLDRLPDWSVETVSDPIEENGLTFRFIQYLHKL